MYVTFKFKLNLWLSVSILLSGLYKFSVMLTFKNAFTDTRKKKSVCENSCELCHLATDTPTVLRANKPGQHQMNLQSYYVP